MELAGFTTSLWAREVVRLAGQLGLSRLHHIQTPDHTLEHTLTRLHTGAHPLEYAPTLQCRTRLHPHLHLSASHRNCPPIEKVHPDSSVAMATNVAHTSITLLPALTQPTEELVEHANEVTEVEVPVSHHALNLVELSKVGGIQGLIAKHPVNGEVFGGSESLLSELVEHAGTDGCCVRAHNVLLSLLQLPVILVTGRGRGGVSGRGGKSGVSGGGRDRVKDKKIVLH